jgi:hypothetical protein
VTVVTTITRAVLAVLGMPVVLGACTRSRGEAPISNRGGAASPVGVRAVDWQNHTYVLAELGAVTVRRGRGALTLDDDGRLDVPGAGGVYQVEPPLYADVDGDGAEDAVIASVTSTGGTGQFSQIQIYALRGGKIVELGAIAGGDRGDGGIRRVAVDGRAVVVDRNVMVEGDGVCCASGAQHERWIWRGGEMIEDVAARRAFTPQR